MKAATGELNLTVITIIAIGAILAFFVIFWEDIEERIRDGWTDATDDPFVYVEKVDSVI